MRKERMTEVKVFHGGTRDLNEAISEWIVEKEREGFRVVAVNCPYPAGASHLYAKVLVHVERNKVND